MSHRLEGDVAVERVAVAFVLVVAAGRAALVAAVHVAVSLVVVDHCAAKIHAPRFNGGQGPGVVSRRMSCVVL